MKRILLALLLCSSFVNAYATFVSGNISANTTWTKANSPYIVNGNLTVDSGYILTIQPGVEVRVDSSRSIFINGKLIAEGSVTDSIIFTPNATSPRREWSGIFFSMKARNDTSSFRYCRVEYANYGIYNGGTSLLVYYCVFRGHRSAAILFANVAWPANCYSAIDRCLITQNGMGVWDAQKTAAPGSFTYNDVTYNTEGYVSQNSSNGMLVNNNNFFYNGTGVSLNGASVRGVRFNVFKGNSYAGLFVPANVIYSPVSNNLFVYNNMGMLLEDVDMATVSNNTLAYNDAGIVHYQSSAPTPSPSNMVIANNCFTNNASYNFRQTSIADFDAKMNWWGDTAIVHIDSFIRDHNDSAALGTVNYLPILTSGAGCQTVTPPPSCNAPTGFVWAIMSPGSVTAGWSSVPGSKGYEYYVGIAGPPSGGTATSDTTFSLSGVVPGDTYHVCIRTRCWQQPFFSAWSCHTITVPKTGISTASQKAQVHIYPNPNNGVFAIDISANMEAGMATVLDVNGRIIQSKTYTAGTKLLFDMKDAAKGVYVVRFTTGTTTSHATMVVN